MIEKLQNSGNILINPKDGDKMLILYKSAIRVAVVNDRRK